MLELRLFGRPVLRYRGAELGVPGAKPLAMLCYLAVQREAVHRKQLTELFWRTTKTGSVRVALSDLRTLSGADEWLVTDGQLVSVNAESDVSAFQRALANEDFSAALNVWRNKPFLHTLEVRKAPEFEDWLAAERSRLQELHTDALRGRAGQLEANRRYDDALALARQILAKDKLDEDAHRRVMHFEHARGNSEGALQQFEHLRRVLKDELGVEPLAETLALLKDIRQSSISSGKTALLLTAPQDVPALPERLIGRADLLSDISAALEAGRVLLHGFGGTGKTALAASFAYDWLEQGRGSVLWLQAGDDTLETLLGAVASAFSAQQQLGQSENTGELLAELLASMSLFVLDDAWNAYALSGLLDLLPKTLPVVVTARQRYGGLKRIDVGRLKREDALDLLEFHAGGGAAVKGSDKSPPPPLNKGGKDLSENTNALCELLGDHPLAVRIAGLSLYTEGLTPAELLIQVRDTPHSMKTPEEFAEEGRESVASLLATSARALSDPAYEALLACGSLHTTSTTPEFLALALRRDEDITEDALIELQRRGLTSRQTTPGSDVITYRLHDLVYSFARANTNLRATSLMTAAQTFLKRHQRDFDLLDAEISNLLGGVQTAARETPEQFVKMMSQLTVGDAYYQARGHSQRSLRLLVEASSLAAELGDVEAAHYLYSRLGDTYRVFYADYDRALGAYEKALELARILEDSHREIILMSTIGGTLFHQQKGDANTYLTEAAKIANQQNDQLALSLVLQHQGYIAGHKRNWQALRHLCLETIMILRRLHSQGKKDSSSTERLFHSLLNLGEAEKNLEATDSAIEARLSALEIAKKRETLYGKLTLTWN